LNKFEKIRVIDTRYSYQIGVIKAKETRLFDRKRFEQFISSEDAKELVSALHDTDYGEYFRSIENYFQYEEALLNARIDLYKEIENFINNEELINVLRSQFDFHNITVLLKGKIADMDFSSFCLPLGTIPINELESIFKEESYDRLPIYLQETVREGIEAYFTHNHDIQLLNLCIDSKMAEYLTTFTKNDFLIGYYKRWIDVTNLKTILRLFFLERYNELIQFALLPGGYIAKEEIIEKKLEGVESLDDIYHSSIYRGLLEHRESFSLVEQSALLLLLSYIRSVAYESIGVEAVISYFLIKENEIRNLRLIFTGKVNNVEDIILKDKLIL
jgi:V/A-type H+-transporting ATPase subunit C